MNTRNLRDLSPSERSEVRSHVLTVMSEFDLSYRQVVRFLRRQYGLRISRSGAFYFLNK